jgi:hypothetical protein
MTRPRHDPVQHFFGGALIGVGFMMMLLCGGCGALFFFGFLFGSLFNSNQDDLGMLALPLLMGGLPAALGFGLLLWGRRLRAGLETRGDSD